MTDQEAREIRESVARAVRSALQQQWVSGRLCVEMVSHALDAGGRATSDEMLVEVMKGFFDVLAEQAPRGATWSALWAMFDVASGKSSGKTVYIRGADGPVYMPRSSSSAPKSSQAR